MFAAQVHHGRGDGRLRVVLQLRFGAALLHWLLAHTGRPIRQLIKRRALRALVYLFAINELPTFGCSFRFTKPENCVN